MGRRSCPLCSHRATLLSGRCTEPDGPAICGCTCPTGQSSPRRPRNASGKPKLIRVLRAVDNGRTSGTGIGREAGLPMVDLRPVLRQCLNGDLLERDAGRGPHPDRYRLTGQGLLLLAQADAV